MPTRKFFYFTYKESAPTRVRIDKNVIEWETWLELVAKKVKLSVSETRLLMYNEEKQVWEVMTSDHNDRELTGSEKFKVEKVP